VATSKVPGVKEPGERKPSWTKLFWRIVTLGPSSPMERDEGEDTGVGVKEMDVVCTLGGVDSVWITPPPPMLSR
jgi:hypothetical protein